MTAAIAKIDPHAPIANTSPVSSLAAITPRGLDDVFRLAEVAAKSGLYGVKSKEDAFVRMATGLELGLSAMQSLRSIWVLNGKPSLGAELMVALCLQHPECEAFELKESTREKATWRTVRKGKETLMTFTIEQARGAGLAGKDVWKSYPETMLRWRCASALAKTVYPEKMMGLLSTEEASMIGSGAAVTVDGIHVVPVAEPSGPRVEIDTHETASALEQTIRAATKEPLLREAGAAVKKAFDAGRISESDRIALSSVYAECKSALKAKKAAPPPDDAERAAIQDAEFSEAAADAEK